MDDKVVPFVPKPSNGPLTKSPFNVEDDNVAELKNYDTGRIEVPQADGSTKSIIFTMDVADWWMALTERMFATMPEGPYGRAFVAYNSVEHGMTEVFVKRKRALEIELTRQQFGQLLEAIPFQLMESRHRTCQFSVAEFIDAQVEDRVIARELPVDLPSAIFIYQIEGERFRLHFIEQDINNGH